MLNLTNYLHNKNGGEMKIAKIFDTDKSEEMYMDYDITDFDLTDVPDYIC